MFILSHPHRFNPFHVGERRLAYLRPSPEVREAMTILQAEKSKQSPEQRQETGRQLATLIQRIDPKAQEAFFQEFGQNVNTLPDIERQEIDRNLRAMAENQTIAGTKANIERLRTKIRPETPVGLVDQAKQHLDTAVDVTSSAVRQSVDVMKQGVTVAKDNTLSFIKNETVRDVLKVAGVGALVGFTLWGLSKLRAGAQKTKEVTKEAASSSWSFLKWVLTGAVLTGIGFGIWKLAEKYKDLQSIASRVEDLRQKLALETDAWKKKAYEKEIAGLRKLQEMYEKKMAEKKEQEVPQTPANRAAKRAQEELEKAKLPASLMMLPPVIVALAGNSKAERKYVTDVLFDMIGKKTTLGDLYRCMHGDIVNQNALSRLFSLHEKATDPKVQRSYLVAGEAVVRFFHQRRSNLEKMYKRSPDAKQNLEEETLERFMQEAGGAYSTLGSILEQAKLHGEKFLSEEPWKNIEQQFLMTQDPIVKAELQKVIDKTKKGRSQFENVSLADVISLTYSGTAFGYLNNAETKNHMTSGTAKPAEEVLYHLCEHIRDNPPNILPFFHGLFPNDRFSEDEAVNRETVNRYLLEKMPLAQAVRLAFYGKMLQSGNPIGLVMMQLEVLRFVSSEEARDWFPETKFRIAERLGKEGVRKLLEEYYKLNPEKVEAVVQEAQQAGETIVTTVGGKVWDVATEGIRNTAGAIKGTAQEGFDWAVENPDKFIPASVLALLVTTGGVKFWYERATLPENFAKSLSAAGEINTFRKQLTKIQALAEIQKRAGTLISELRAKIVTEGMGQQGLDILHNFLKSPTRNLAELSKMEKELRTLSGALPHEIASIIQSLRTEKSILAAIQHHRWYTRLPLWMGKYPVIAPYNVAKMTVEGGRIISNATGVTRLTQEVLGAVKNVAPEIPGMLRSMPQWMADAFNACKPALQMLINAIRTGGMRGLQYMMRLATVAKFAGRSLGPAAGSFDIALGAAELVMNRARIEGTDNESLKELYAMRDFKSASQVALGGGTIGTMVATGVTSGATLAVGAISAEVYVAYWYYEKLEEASGGWLKEEADWAKKSPDALLAKLMELKPGSQEKTFDQFGQKIVYGTQAEWLWRKATYSRNEFRKAEEENFKALENENAGTRYKLCRAYVVKTTKPLALPDETPQQFKNRYDQLVMDQIQYIGWMTQGQFDTVNMDVFRSALRHAELIAVSRKLQEKGESMVIDRRMDADGKTEKFDLAIYADLPPKKDDKQLERGKLLQDYKSNVEQAAKVLQINVALELGETGQALEQLVAMLLSDMQGPLQRMEAKLQATDYPGIADGYEMDLARYEVYEELRDRLDDIGVALLQEDDITVEQYDKGLARLAAALQREPMEFYNRGIAKNPNISLYRDRTDLLSVEGLFKELAKS
ncbi:hypothetical protein HYZ99_05410 [Candidatus Peregrinibacteria bacterium]|nr:hypothetical protein [Candidatus Peregrinibacteria bacterium]